MSNFKKSILSSFILVSFSLFYPVLVESNFKNNSDWNLLTQFFVLWLLVSVLIYQINSINKKIGS